MNEAVITIKLSDNEIDLLVNSLEMLESAIVPCVDNGQWKVPYEQLKGDLQIIQKDIIDRKKEHIIKQNMEVK
jgi:hypothetical protein